VTTTGALTLSASSENQTSAKADGTSIINAQFDASTAIDDSAETIQLAVNHNLHTATKSPITMAMAAPMSDFDRWKPVLRACGAGDKVELYDTQARAKAASSDHTGRQDLSAATGAAQSLELDRAPQGQRCRGDQRRQGGHHGEPCRDSVTREARA